MGRAVVAHLQYACGAPPRCFAGLSHPRLSVPFPRSVAPPCYPSSHCPAALPRPVSAPCSAPCPAPCPPRAPAHVSPHALPATPRRAALRCPVQRRPAPPCSAPLRPSPPRLVPHRAAPPRPTPARPAVQHRPVPAPATVPHQFRTALHCTASRHTAPPIAAPHWSHQITQRLRATPAAALAHTVSLLRGAVGCLPGPPLRIRVWELAAANRLPGPRRHAAQKMISCCSVAWHHKLYIQ